eukprot:TRINITY_DN507_c0_g1_i1.p1 TRINITY_DN507_c0_g1~~TRINITY_DN507_c0_g1_i1.p1  ORF type:complete len:607 (+),score=109.04 TRINITY_DN507_c0_g1_i1:75-1895(+)
MGNGSSLRQDEVSSLQQICGAEPLPSGHAAWQVLRHLKTNLAMLPPATAQAILEPLCDPLAANLSAGNFATLVEVSSSMASSSNDAVANLLVLIRIICKVLFHNAKESEIAQLFGLQAPPRQLSAAHFTEIHPGSGTVICDTLFDTSYQLLLNADVTSTAHACACDLLLGLSTQPHLAERAVSTPLGGEMLAQVVRQLLMPETAAATDAHESSKATWRITKWARDFLQGNSWMAAVTALLMRRAVPWPVSTSERIALLVLALVLQPTSNNSALAAVAAARDTDDPTPAELRFQFRTMFSVVARLLNEDAGVLMLYVLLYHNHAFMQYTLARTDIHMLVLPLLKQLYDGRGKHPHQLYMPLITLLMLSQHNSFHAQLHAIMQPGQLSWFQERRLESLDLASFMIIVVSRTVLRNFVGTRDVYLTTNCLALLGNMVKHVHDMHPYAADRLVTLVRVLYKRVTRCDPTEEEMYWSFLKLALQIIHTSIEATLARSAHLVYALMQANDLFETLSAASQLSETAPMLHATIRHFMQQLHVAEDISVQKALTTIAAAASSIQIPQASPLHFTYTEDSSSSEFFWPYIQALIAGYLGWDSAGRVALDVQVVAS